MGAIYISLRSSIGAVSHSLLVLFRVSRSCTRRSGTPRFLGARRSAHVSVVSTTHAYPRCGACFPVFSSYAYIASPYLWSSGLLPFYESVGFPIILREILSPKLQLTSFAASPEPSFPTLVSVQKLQPVLS